MKVDAIGYKLFKRRANGTLGSLYMQPKTVLPVDEWLAARLGLRCESSRRGLAYRPGWHIAMNPTLPHLSRKAEHG